IIAKGRRGRRRRRRAAMNETTLSPRALRIAAPALLALIVVALWQLLTDLYSVPSYLVPSPTVVAKTLVDDRELLLRSLSVTLGVALTELLANADTASNTRRVALFLRRPADRERARADRRRRRRIRRRNGREQRRPRLSDSAGRVSAQHSAPFCGAGLDHRRRRRAVRAY